MFKRILVPLDGSSLAEAVLPVVTLLANRLHSTITLVHIIERDAPSSIHGEKHLKQADEAVAYLNEVAKRFFQPNISVETHVHTTAVSDIARSIIEHGGELEPDLIVMCTHGNGGLKELVVGSIAQQVIGAGRQPVLLIQPSEQIDDQTPNFKKFLVALDGEPEHETGMTIVGELACIMNAELHFLTVVETLTTLGHREAATGLLLPTATAAMLEMEEEFALEHLQDLAQTWLAKGLEVTVEVRRGDAAQNIVDTGKRCNADLIVVGTHGKAGLNAFWAGSVAPRLPAMTTTPILLIPVR